MAEMKLLFSVLRALDAGVATSAQGLAAHLGVPRAKVAAVLAEARELGVPIAAHPGRGYALGRPVDWLDAARVMSAMGPASAHCELRLYDRVGSTNDVILAIEDAPPDRSLVVAAELQEGGRGRRGRRWASGVANALTFTLLWQVRARLAMLSAASLVVGVGLRRAMAQAGAAGVQLKWPNDLLCSGGKLGGVLIEAVPDRGAGVLAIGVGINVRVPQEVKAAIDQPVADLTGLGIDIDRSTILGLCLRHLLAALAQFEDEGFVRLRQEWLAHAAFVGENVTLRHSQGTSESGVMNGIDDEGALLLATPQGRKKIYSGDVSLRADAGMPDRKPS